MTGPLVPIGRPQDTYPFDRNARAAIRRVGVIVSAAAGRLTVTVPGGTLTNVMYTTAVTATPGARVQLVYDRDAAIAIGMLT